MGNDAKSSALNKYCQAHEVRNLFVTDAASFVTSPDENPTLSIPRAFEARLGISPGAGKDGEYVASLRAESDGDPHDWRIAQDGSSVFVKCERTSLIFVRYSAEVAGEKRR
jgi:GMC oxidoreductase